MGIRYNFIKGDSQSGKSFLMSNFKGSPRIMRDCTNQMINNIFPILDSFVCFDSLLLDEPTNQLNKHNTLRFVQKVKQWSKENKDIQIWWITHQNYIIDEIHMKKRIIKLKIVQ